MIGYRILFVKVLDHTRIYLRALIYRCHVGLPARSPWRFPMLISDAKRSVRSTSRSGARYYKFVTLPLVLLMYARDLNKHGKAARGALQFKASKEPTMEPTALPAAQLNVGD